MIYHILSSKQHNAHYLQRYIKFIYLCIEHNNKNPSVYTEKHHICPKSKNMFPEYKNFKKHPWNLAELTYRQHIIAHILLYKTFKTECQALSVLYTFGQKNANEIINTKSVEKIKIELSKHRKGKFTRGYDLDGTPRVKNSTKEKLSKIKKQFYSDPENRKKQSLSCTGTTGRVSQKYSSYARNRPEKHNQKISESIKNLNKNKSDIERKRIKSGIYVTPIGNFTSTKLHRYCLDADKKINKHNCKHKNTLFNETVIGMTYRELGFFFIPKNDPKVQEYYVDLNLAHPPEPNHPLASKLNDFLLHEKLLL